MSFRDPLFSSNQEKMKDSRVSVNTNLPFPGLRQPTQNAKNQCFTLPRAPQVGGLIEVDIAGGFLDGLVFALLQALLELLFEQLRLGLFVCRALAEYGFTARRLFAQENIDPIKVRGGLVADRRGLVGDHFLQSCIDGQACAAAGARH